jgi:hypothetical protein
LSPHVKVPHARSDADIPVLRFGMIGFNAGQRQKIEQMVLALPVQTVVWQPGLMADADAWLVCGDKTRALPLSASTGMDSVSVLAGLPSEQTVTLNLHQIDRPLAFSLPMNNPAMAPRLTFDASSPASVQAVLEQFERCLASLRSQCLLGKQLIEREPELRAATYHVLHGSKLLAVMDLISWKIGMLPDTDPQQYEHALWEKRPVEGHAIPNSFLMTDAAQLRWTYTQHTRRNVLPVRYSREVIYLRQSPHIPVSWLADSHLLVLHELSVQAATFVDLAERTGLPHEVLTRDLACLYFAAALTTRPGKALQAQHQPRSTSGNPSSMFNPRMQLGQRMMPGADTTVAAQLRPE